MCGFPAKYKEFISNDLSPVFNEKFTYFVPDTEEAMTNQLAAYSKFYSPDNAQYLIELLQQHHISYSLDHEVNQLDKIYIGDAVEAMYVLNIPPERFKDVNNLLAEMAITDMAQPGFEHYMNSYSNEELNDIINNPADWSAYDLQVAATLLSIREDIAVTVPETTAEEFKPAKLDTIWIVVGYLACFAGITTYVFLGIMGFFAGFAIRQAKHRLKNGEKVNTYTETDRRHGLFMMILSFVFMLAGILLFIFRR